jgi:hypothetical protein
MVSCCSILLAIASITVCYGSLQSDIDMEGQACAAMAAALPQLQTLSGRNHYKSTNIISAQYHLSFSSYQTIPSHELYTCMHQVGPLQIALGQEEILFHRGAPTAALLVKPIRWWSTLPESSLSI